MGRSRETYGKKEVKKKQLKKRKDKENKRLEKKEQEKTGGLDDMLAWVDENGQIVSVPPDKSKRTEIKAENIEINIPKSESGSGHKTKTGRVLNYNDSRGYGFISSPSLSESVFFHDADCLERISVGDQVEFETEKGLKGLKAVNVKKT